MYIKNILIILMFSLTLSSLIAGREDKDNQEESVTINKIPIDPNLPILTLRDPMDSRLRHEVRSVSDVHEALEQARTHKPSSPAGRQGVITRQPGASEIETMPSKTSDPCCVMPSCIHNYIRMMCTPCIFCLYFTCKAIDDQSGY